MWSLRVREQDLLDHERLLQLAHDVGKKAHEHEYDYSAPFGVSAEQREYLSRTWGQLASSGRTPLADQSPPPPDVVFAATDATRKGRVFVIFKPDGTISAADVGFAPAAGEQAVQELRAVLDLAAELSRRWPRLVHIIQAMDAEAARSALQKGYSTSSEFRDILRQLRTQGYRLTTVHVPTQDNVADEPSRELPIVEARRLATGAFFAEACNTKGVALRIVSVAKNFPSATSSSLFQEICTLISCHLCSYSSLQMSVSRLSGSSVSVTRSNSRPCSGERRSGDLSTGGSTSLSSNPCARAHTAQK